MTRLRTRARFIERWKSTERQNGFTLLELLLALGLAVVLFGMIWEMMRLYSGHYYLTERKVTRSQLIRSLAEMLDDDLMAAIQDPIQPLEAHHESQARSIRRFGLRGTETSLQIDVIEPDALANVADAEKNRRFATGMQKLKGKQVPELKTIIYEFVSPGQTEGQNQTNQTGQGSQLVGSLDTIAPRAFPDSPDSSPLLRRFGLSRRELDFETPVHADSTQAADGSQMTGSLTSLPELDLSVLHSGNPEQVNPDHITVPNLSAVQLAMLTMNRTRWAPEVIDLQFRYFDGTNWLNRWNSIEKNGLPLAVEVRFKLLPLEEIDLLRASPVYREFVRAQTRSQTVEESGSRLVGSLTSDGLFAPLDYGDPLALQPVPQSLDEVISQLGLTTPIDRRLVSWLPTTPLGRHRIQERRVPVPDRAGTYTLGSERVGPRPRERSPVERTVRQRTGAPAPSDFDSIEALQNEFARRSDQPRRSTESDQPVTMSAPPSSRPAQTERAGGWIRGERNR